MDSKIDTDWALFLEGKTSEAQKLVEQDFSIDTCTDFSLLNLMGYLLLAEKDYASCTHIFEKYILLAQQNEDKEKEHIGLHQLAMIYRDQGDFHKALKLIEDEEKIVEEVEDGSEKEKRYVGNFENTTGHRINYIDINISFYDENDKIYSGFKFETRYLWENGTKKSFEFSIPDSDKKFKYFKVNLGENSFRYE